MGSNQKVLWARAVFQLVNCLESGNHLVGGPLVLLTSSFSLFRRSGRKTHVKLTTTSSSTIMSCMYPICMMHVSKMHISMMHVTKMPVSMIWWEIWNSCLNYPFQTIVFKPSFPSQGHFLSWQLANPIAAYFCLPFSVLLNNRNWNKYLHYYSFYLSGAL